MSVSTSAMSVMLLQCATQCRVAVDDAFSFSPVRYTDW